MANERIKRIVVREQGGYAGVDQVVADIDVAALDPATRQHVEQAIASAGLFGLSGTVGDAAGFDLLQQVVTVTTEDGRQHSATFVDTGGQETAPLRQLVETLRSV
jgi:hypothetical protein